jgi:NitT/TauT family transport system ATP-binding protein
MITIENLCFLYRQEHPIFRDFNWSIARGERWSVIGPSGCGKTTLLYLLAGLYTPTTGKVNIDGSLLSGPRVSTGLILQDYGLLPWATAFDNISLGLKIRRLDNLKAARVTTEWLSRLDISAVSDHYPAELSGGQRQRVAIARALALEPDLLLMDEPFASLDALTREELQNLTIYLWESMFSTIILVTHNIEEAVLLGTRIMILRHPPNTEPVIIENPGSGNSLYRETPDFTERCREVRELIEYNSRNGRAGNATTSEERAWA